MEIYIEPQLAQPHLVVIGHLATSEALVRLGNDLGWRVSVLAEIVQHWRQAPLSNTESPISNLELPIAQAPANEVRDPVCIMTVEIATTHFSSKYVQVESMH